MNGISNKIIMGDQAVVDLDQIKLGKCFVSCKMRVILVCMLWPIRKIFRFYAF